MSGGFNPDIFVSHLKSKYASKLYITDSISEQKSDGMNAPKNF